MKLSHPLSIKLLFWLITLFIITSCSFTGDASSDAPATQVYNLSPIPLLPTSAVQPSETSTVAGFESPPAPAEILYVKTETDNVNLRSNPGRLFDVIRVMLRGSRMEYLGALPNGQWLKVRTGEGVIGWVLTELVEANFEPIYPYAVPDNVLLITGTVLDANNNPITGVGISISKDEQSDNTLTVEDGIYYLYVPATLSGNWSLKQETISCNSNIMNENCKCIVEGCGVFEPTEYLLRLPLSLTLYDFKMK
ncbi:MAG: Bacterial domain [Chloroflexota bacterium]